VTTSLEDNGDHDGFADTDETVTLFLTVKNTSGVALSDVTARLHALRPEQTCVSVPEIAIGDLAVDQVVTTGQGFVFTVSSIDRASLGLGPYDALAATFSVSIDAEPGPQPAVPARITLDLDLDVSGGSGSTTYFESFESAGGSMGTFEVQNLDVGLASLEASEGYRCQYNDPDNPNSNLSPNPNCYVGSSAAHNDAVFWGMSGPAFSPEGGRGFSGFHSMFYGVDLGPPQNWTTPINVLEAARMTDPVHLAADGPAPVLRFKHQCSLADTRDFADEYDRGVVMVQVADAAGDPVGPWFKVDPYQNPYDQRNGTRVLNCSFDPIDDGSTEDDSFAPGYPVHRFGPSSTCYPEWVFANIGETSDPFAASNVGLADGPGLQGLWGIGTWIESKVDLSRFRGRSVRVRFLAASLDVNGVPTDPETWEETFPGINPIPGEDGWWIDDIEITGLVATPATVAVDVKDNGGLPDVGGADGDLDGLPNVCDNCASTANPDQADSELDEVGDACDVCPFSDQNFDPDLDGLCGTDDNCPFVANPGQSDFDGDQHGFDCDCNDLDDTIHPGAEEANDGVDENCTGDVDEITGVVGFFDPGGSKTQLSWAAQAGATRYQVARSSATDFTSDCAQSQVNGPLATITPLPASGQVQYILVRSSVPNRGSWGLGSQGVPRTVSCAP
jgi:hypothetical protein